MQLYKKLTEQYWEITKFISYNMKNIWIWIYSDGYDDTKMKLSGKFYYNKVSSIQWKFKAQRNAKISWKAQKGSSWDIIFKL